MEKKINIADLLRDCPQGMELDCTIFDNVVFERVDFSLTNYPIVLKRMKDGISFFVTKYGQCCDSEDCKCAIFPKGKTTWEGFTPPCQFKDGDILTTITGSIFIYKKIDVYNYCGIYASLDIINGFLPTYCSYLEDCCRLATEEEKAKLFKAIKDNGYRWNPETKTLVKLPKFKVGYRIRSTIVNSGNIYTVLKIEASKYIVKKNNETSNCNIYFDEENNFELVPNKFDISKLKPFDKVLVRDFDNETWEINFFSKLLDGKHFKCLDLTYVQCIPYEGNEHLLNTTNDCDYFYKTWEK